MLSALKITRLPLRTMFISAGWPIRTSLISSPGCRSVTWLRMRSQAIPRTAGTTTSMKGCGASAQLLGDATKTLVTKRPCVFVWARHPGTSLFEGWLPSVFCRNVLIQPPVLVASGGEGWRSFGWQARMHLCGGINAERRTTAGPQPGNHWLCHL